MKKIMSLFKFDYDENGKRTIKNEINKGAEWVINREGIATKKYDGTCCMIKDCELYKRYDCKQGKQPPEGFIPYQEPDEVTGHYPGWIKCVESDKDNKYHFEAFNNLKKEINNINEFTTSKCKLEDGTYELCGHA